MPSRRQPSNGKRLSGARRAAAVAAVAGMLLAVPGIAQAAFSSKASGQVTASTLTLTAPAGASVRASCLLRSLDVSVTSYGTVPRATSYEFILRDPSGVTVQTSNGSYLKLGAARGTWTYQIRGIYTASPGNVWTGTPYQGSVTC